MPSPSVAKLERLAWALLIGGAFAWMGHFALGEADVFWSLHLGAQALGGDFFPVSGSFTVPDARTPNYQGLYSLLLQWLHTNGGAEALIRLRAAVHGAFFAGLALWITGPVFGSRARWILGSLLVTGLGYVIGGDRLYLRADLLANLSFLGLIAAWGMPGAAPRSRLVLSLASIVLMTNFHGGVAPVAIGLTWIFLFFASDEELPLRPRERALWALAAGLCWFASPIGVHIVEPIARHFTGFDWSLMRNRDQAPIEPYFFSIEVMGWTYWLWLGSLLAAPIAWRIAKPELRRMGPLFSSPKLLGLTLLALTVLTIGKSRARLLEVPVLMVPVACLLENLWIRASRGKRWGIAVLIGFSAWVWIDPVADWKTRFAGPFASTLDRSKFPVESARFVARVRPKGHLFNAFDYGGYLLRALPEYPVAFHGLCLPFFALMTETFESLRDPPAFTALLDRLSINVVIETPPASRLGPGGTIQTTHDAYFPRSVWAPVFFDNASVVYVRRIPEHRALIASHEYKYIGFGIPADFSFVQPDPSPELIARTRAELERCLAQDESNLYCRAGQAASLAFKPRPNRPAPTRR